MEDIKIRKEKQNGIDWRFIVSIGSEEYYVILDKEYWQKLTWGKGDPIELVKCSFEFLLARESKESILPRFNLREITRYFPEYETEIKKQLKAANSGG
jgi:hypothetical protein